MRNKIIKNIGCCLLGILPLVSCEINDPIDELVKAGEKAANVYMEIPMANVGAGNDVEFYTEYWSEDDAYKNLELWYSIHTRLNYNLTASLTNYTFTLDSTELAREAQKIVAYDHSVENYDAERYAYIIEDAFPISYTLSPSNINTMLTYDQKQIERFFPASVVDRFYAGFFETLNYDYLHQLLVVKYERMTDEEFEAHFDVVEIPDPDEAGNTIEIKVMKEESAPVLKGMIREIPLEDLIYNPLKLYYDVVFTKSYELNAKFRVVNGQGVENFSEEKVVTVL